MIPMPLAPMQGRGGPAQRGWGGRGASSVVHWGARKRQNATWQAWQKKSPLVLNVHFTLFEDSATGDALARLRAQPGRYVSRQGHTDQPQQSPRKLSMPHHYVNESTGSPSRAGTAPAPPPAGPPWGCGAPCVVPCVVVPCGVVVVVVVVAAAAEPPLLPPW